MRHLTDTKCECQPKPRNGYTCEHGNWISSELSTKSFVMAEVKLPCRRCGFKNKQKDRYHCQMGFEAYWFCRDKEGCKARKEAMNKK